MQKKRILIVSGAFYPLISPRSLRTTELAKEFSRQGHEVVVYIPDEGYDYSDFLKDNPMQIKYLGTPRLKSIELKGGKLVKLLRRVARRTLSLLLEYPNIELMCKVSKYVKKESSYDLMISIAVPHPIHWGVSKIRTKHRRIANTWVADCGDPYMGVTADTFRKMFYFKYLEKRFCRRADYISIPYRGGISGYYPEFHEKIRIIPQGFEMQDLKLPKFSKKAAYPVFAYAGSLFPGQHDPRPMLSFLSTYEKEFKFILYTREKALVEPFQETLGDKVEVREYVPREELLRVLANMDFLINYGYSSGTQLPHKLIDYAITGRPVLNIPVETDFQSLVEFMEGNYSGRMELSPPEDYDIRKVTEKFLQIHSV